MRERLLDLVVCPACRGPLALEDGATAEAEEILTGTLRCSRCGSTTEILRGVPRFAGVSSDERSQTAERFAASWARFDRIDEHYEAQFRGWIAPNEPADFEGRIVLEGGCGKGRHSALVADWGARDVIAVDLGAAVDVAFRNTRHLENVHVVQADLLNLPLAEDVVDVAFSVGVLHHIASPVDAFLQLVRRVRPGGKVIAWVYGRENNGWIVYGVNPVRELVTSRLPFSAVEEIAKLPAALLWLASRGIYRPLSRGLLGRVGQRLYYRDYMNQLADFPYWELHCIVADHLVPPIAHYIRHEEFSGWFDRAGLVDVTITWHNQNSWRGTGRRPDRPGEPPARD